MKNLKVWQKLVLMGTVFMLPFAVVTYKMVSSINELGTDFLSAGVTVDEAPYLGPVAKDERGLIQWIEVKKLLPESVRELLFRKTVAPNLTDATDRTAGGDP